MKNLSETGYAIARKRNIILPGLNGLTREENEMWSKPERSIIMSRRRKRHRAYQFHDNPKVRGGRDHKRINVAEPWERAYAGIKKRSWRVRSHLQKVRGSSHKVRVKGYVAHRHYRKKKR